MSDDTLIDVEMSAAEIRDAVNGLTVVLVENGYLGGTKGMAYVMLFWLFQHRASGYDLESALTQMKTCWSILDQLDKGKTDKDLSRNN